MQGFRCTCWRALTHARPHRLRSKKGPLFRLKLSEDIISDAIGSAGREEGDDQRTPLLVIKLFHTER